MSSLALNTEPLAASARCTDDELIVLLEDGRVIAVPLLWFPRLAAAKREQREALEIMGHGQGIHWPQVDEDISVRGLLAGKPSVEYRAEAVAG
jgi:hypothetical protein